jgi:glutaredoxin
MFTMASCPYCVEALRWMDELFSENAGYSALEIEKIDELEHPDIAEQYDYYYVPTFYAGGKKLHEGAASPDKIRRVFDAAMTCEGDRDGVNT